MDILLFKKAIILAIALMAQQIVTFDCNLPNGCFLQSKKYAMNMYNYEKSHFKTDVREIKSKQTKALEISKEIIAFDFFLCFCVSVFVYYIFFYIFVFYFFYL